MTSRKDDGEFITGKEKVDSQKNIAHFLNGFITSLKTGPRTGRREIIWLIIFLFFSGILTLMHYLMPTPSL